MSDWVLKILRWTPFKMLAWLFVTRLVVGSPSASVTEHEYNARMFAFLGAFLMAGFDSVVDAIREKAK